MLDLKLIRSDPERVKAALARRGAADSIDELMALDDRRRELLPEIEGARNRRRQASEQIGLAKKSGEDASAAIAEVRELKAELEQMENELSRVEEGRDTLAASLPNIPDPDSPDGFTDEDAVTLRVVGTPPEFSFEPKDHLELAEAGSMIDMEAGARTSGARFAYLKGDLVMLEFALVRWAMSLLREEGHEPVIPPILVREEALFGTGFLPGDRDQIYELPKDELFLAPPGGIPAESSGFTSLTRWRCSHSLNLTGQVRSRNESSRSRSGSLVIWACLTGWLTWLSVTLAARQPGSSTARPGFRARADTGS